MNAPGAGQVRYAVPMPLVKSGSLLAHSLFVPHPPTLIIWPYKALKPRLYFIHSTMLPEPGQSPPRSARQGSSRIVLIRTF